ADAGQIDDQERRDEGAEAIDERAAEEDPDAGGKSAKLVAERHGWLRVAGCELRGASRNRQRATRNYGAISGSARKNFCSSASSNCVPAPSSRRRRASCALMAGWYERRELMATKASQIWMTREASGMAVPLKRLG